MNDHILLSHQFIVASSRSLQPLVILPDDDSYVCGVCLSIDLELELCWMVMVTITSVLFTCTILFMIDRCKWYLYYFLLIIHIFFENKTLIIFDIFFKFLFLCIQRNIHSFKWGIYTLTSVVTVYTEQKRTIGRNF